MSAWSQEVTLISPCKSFKAYTRCKAYLTDTSTLHIQYIHTPLHRALPWLGRAAEKAWHELKDSCYKTLSQHLPREAVQRTHTSKMSAIQTLETWLLKLDLMLRICVELSCTVTTPMAFGTCTLRLTPLFICLPLFVSSTNSSMFGLNCCSKSAVAGLSSPSA